MPYMVCPVVKGGEKRILRGECPHSETLKYSVAYALAPSSGAKGGWPWNGAAEVMTAEVSLDDAKFQAQ